MKFQLGGLSRKKRNCASDVYRVVIVALNVIAQKIVELMDVKATIVDGCMEGRSVARLTLRMKRLHPKRRTPSQTSIRILLLVNVHLQLHYARSLSLFETETDQSESTCYLMMAVHEPT